MTWTARDAGAFDIPKSWAAAFHLGYASMSADTHVSNDIIWEGFLGRLIYPLSRWHDGKCCETSLDDMAYGTGFTAWLTWAAKNAA